MRSGDETRRGPLPGSQSVAVRNVMAPGPLRAVVLAFALLVAPLAAQAQPGLGLARIGVLTLSTASSTPDVEAFRQGLREHGYAEGQNIAFEYRDAAGRADRLPTLAGELVRLKVDVIVTQSNVAALAAKRATQTIPIVMAIAGDPVKGGVVGSLASPGGNVTGLTLMQTELSRKRLQLLREAAPSTTLVAVIWNPTDPPAADFLRLKLSAHWPSICSIRGSATGMVRGVLKAGPE